MKTDMAVTEMAEDIGIHLLIRVTGGTMDIGIMTRTMATTGFVAAGQEKDSLKYLHIELETALAGCLFFPVTRYMLPENETDAACLPIAGP